MRTTTRTMTTTSGLRRAARMALGFFLIALWLGRSYDACADSIVERAATALVYGTSADTYSFETPSAGTVTAVYSGLPWPTPLAALSFSLTTATDAFQPMPGTEATSQSGGAGGGDTYQVGGAGTYFAHIIATAGPNPFNLGLYSLILTFTPSAVPLPTAAGLLLMGILVLLALRGTLRSGTRNESVMYPA